MEWNGRIGSVMIYRVTTNSFSLTTHIDVYYTGGKLHSQLKKLPFMNLNVVLTKTNKRYHPFLTRMKLMITLEFLYKF